MDLRQLEDPLPSPYWSTPLEQCDLREYAQNILVLALFTPAKEAAYTIEEDYTCSCP